MYLYSSSLDFKPITYIILLQNTNLAFIIHFAMFREFALLTNQYVDGHNCGTWFLKKEIGGGKPVFCVLVIHNVLSSLTIYFISCSFSITLVVSL